MPISTLGENPVYYQPDFLVRRWSDNQAFLVEIKNLEIKGAVEKVIRSEMIARNYIQQNSYDWQFHLRLSDDIDSNLSPEQLKYFMREVCSTKETFDSKRKFQKIDKQFYTGSPDIVGKPKRMPCFIKGQEVSEVELKKYLWLGELPEWIK